MLAIVFISVALVAGLVSAAPSPYSTNNTYTGSAPKYVFMFIGDGMSTPQINAAQMYMENMDSTETPAIKTLDFAKFPSVGSADTYDAESFIPDNKAGLNFSTYSHSGLAVPVYALGTGYQLFYGAYDDTDINKKLAAITKVNK